MSHDDRFDLPPPPSQIRSLIWALSSFLIQLLHQEQINKDQFVPFPFGNTVESVLVTNTGFEAVLLSK
jgi:hypothetical protein